MWATVGLHPHDAEQRRRRPSSACSTSPRSWPSASAGSTTTTTTRPGRRSGQAFAAQIALAHAHDLALVIHTREAWDDTFAILAAEGVPERTVFHCFTGGPDEARRCLDLGAHLSFSGIVTFKPADDVRAAAALCPLDRLLVETDAPSSPRCPTGADRTSPRSSRSWAKRWRRPRASTPPPSRNVPL